MRPRTNVGRRGGRALVRAGSALALASLGLVLDNVRRLRVPPPSPAAPRERISVLVPARDEALGIDATLGALRTAMDATTALEATTALNTTSADGIGGPQGLVEVLVLDDGSHDDTAARIAAAAARDPRIRLLHGTPPPPGWGGKAWACHRLALQARASSVLVFLDADVVLTPDALVAGVAMLRDGGLDLLSPVPRLDAVGPAERLVQPLVPWSWLSTLPLAAAERGAHPMLAAAVGGFLVVDAAAYRRSGGHAADPGAVLDDVALLRTIKGSGGRGTVAAGHTLAHCRMYRGAAEVRAGYEKSLWAAFGSPPAAAAVLAGLVLAYVLPPLAALAGSRAGLVGTVAGVAGRVVAARHTGARTRDAVAHPVSVAALVALTVDSHVRRARGTLRWRSRALVGPARTAVPAVPAATAALAALTDPR